MKIRWTWCVCAVALLATVGCGGSDDESGSTTAPDKAEKVSTAVERPEGTWNLAFWTTEREGAALGDALQSVVTFTPKCDSGPCDIDITPAGANGTYRPEGYPVADPVEPGTPYTATWDEKSGTYVRHDEPKLDSCTTADGKVVQDGYSVERTTTYEFEPAKDSKPASVHGTYVEVATGTPTGAPQGCTDYKATWTVAGAPADAFAEGGPSFADSYVITEIVEATEPVDQRPKGFRGVIAADAKVTTEGDSVLLAGTRSVPAKLTETDGAWSGSATDATSRCSEGDGPAEYDSTETWTGLRTIALTQQGTPILAGRWDVMETPNATGQANGCTVGSNKGYVILVPSAAVA